MQCCSCYSNKYNEIKMCDLEPFSEIQSQLVYLTTKCMPEFFANSNIDDS